MVDVDEEAWLWWALLMEREGGVEEPAEAPLVSPQGSCDGLGEFCLEDLDVENEVIARSCDVVKNVADKFGDGDHTIVEKQLLACPLAAGAGGFHPHQQA